jgi:hypothetical protein
MRSNHTYTDTHTTHVHKPFSDSRTRLSIAVFVSFPCFSVVFLNSNFVNTRLRLTQTTSGHRCVRVRACVSVCWSIFYFSFRGYWLVLGNLALSFSLWFLQVYEETNFYGKPPIFIFFVVLIITEAYTRWARNPSSRLTQSPLYSQTVSIYA